MLFLDDVNVSSHVSSRPRSGLSDGTRRGNQHMFIGVDRSLALHFATVLVLSHTSDFCDSICIRHAPAFCDSTYASSVSSYICVFDKVIPIRISCSSCDSSDRLMTSLHIRPYHISHDRFLLVTESDVFKLRNCFEKLTPITLRAAIKAPRGSCWVVNKPS